MHMAQVHRIAPHELNPVNPAHEVVVGWNPRLWTSYADVLDTTADKGSDACAILRIGTNPREVVRTDTILATARPYAPAR